MSNNLSPSPRSPEAFAHYRALVERDNAFPIWIRHDLEVTEVQHTWDQITALEVIAFGINPRLLNALLWAHVRYEEMIGVTDIEFCSFRDAERAAYPEFFRGDCISSVDDAAAFMAISCELPYTQALLWTARHMVQVVRSNLIQEAIVPAPWVYASM